MVTANRYMFRPLTGHHQVVHTMKRVGGCQLMEETPQPLLMQTSHPDQGISWLSSVPPYKCCYSPSYEAALNPLKAELNPICCLLALLGAHHFLHVGKIRVKSLTLRLLMSCVCVCVCVCVYIYIYIYGAPILDVSRSHTTTHHSR